MESCFGPTFAEFYISDLEDRFFGQIFGLKPNVYSLYVDEISIVVEE